MRAIAVILIVVGVICLAVPSFTFFTQERVVDAGFFHVDVSKPHTIILNPAVGIIALAAGVIMLLSSKRQTA